MRAVLFPAFSADIFVQFKDSGIKTVENHSHTHAQAGTPTHPVTLIALFQWSPLNGGEAGGCSLQDTSAGVAFQTEKLKL